MVLQRAYKQHGPDGFHSYLSHRAIDKHGNTALHIAAEFGHAKICGVADVLITQANEPFKKKTNKSKS